MGFDGWPVEAIEFFEGLEADNSKAYWTGHKPVYDQCVRAPMEALLAELAPAHGEGKIFRPNRDIRFSKDKSPYKTNIAATMAEGGYVSLDADQPVQRVHEFLKTAEPLVTWLDSRVGPSELEEGWR